MNLTEASKVAKFSAVWLLSLPIHSNDIVIMESD